MGMQFKELFDGVYTINGKIATANLVKQNRVYGEELISLNGTEYRLWNPYRSKLAAALLKGLKSFGIKRGDTVLYLGAATGTTASHVSDIVGTEGRVFCVEISERNVRELLNVCEARENMVPLLADARFPERYDEAIGVCNIIYQDVAAKDQSDILKINSRLLKKGGYAYFIIKSQSIDISKAPERVFESELENLKGLFKVVERIGLEPYDSMHLFSVLKRL